MRINKTLITIGLLSSASFALAHGPHREVTEQSLLHLLEHAWPVLPFAILGLLLWRWQTRS